MEILVGPVVDLAKCLYVPFKRHCGYLCCYAKNVKELEDEVKSLQKRMEYMNEKLDEESRSNMTPVKEVKDWKGSVDKAVEEAEVLSRQMKEEQRCLMGWCPKLRWRHGVGKKASKQIDQVQKLKENGDRYLSSGTTSHPRPPADVEEIRPGDEFVATEGATTVMEQVMDALGDDKVRYIGIRGMGGIGKTTLVKNINNKLKGSTLFDKVIFVTVSQNQSLNVIQDQIAERLGMKLFDKVNYLRANRLSEELRKLKSLLIILDDVWTEVKVVELGLPRKNEHECCKIIVTTRNRQVCVQMGMDKEFEVEPLSEKDSWILFESKVGDVWKNQNLLEVGKKIVNKCGGSPLAIVTLGSTLAQEKDKNMWLDALRRLRSSEPTQLDGIIPQVITSIKFSYDHLKDQGMKFCFLFCSLFPEDYDIALHNLRIFCIGEGFLDVQGKCLDAKVQLMAYIKKLKNCSLLLEGYTSNFVKMHDIVRLTAQSIASKEGQGFIEKTRLGLTHWPKLDNEEECKRLSLIGNYDMETLPESSNFPQLRTLLLKECYGITYIPDDFFIGMHALVNLDLSGSFLPRWPMSISLLTNLRSLLLSSKMRAHSLDIDIVDLTQLKNLEVLVIRGGVTIPVEFSEQSNLKILDLREVHLELIPANVIRGLHNLEELYLNIEEISRISDEEKGGCKLIDEIRSGASLVEVATLKRLVVLQVRVTEEEVLLMPNNSWGHKLQEFMIVFGNNDFELDLFESGNTLFFGKLPKLVPQWVICLIQKVEHLHLESPALKKVICLDTVSALKHMEISNCSTISQIASIEEEEEAPFSINGLGRLEKLKLVRLSNLENIIFQGPQYLNITESFVMNLRVLEVTHCCKLVNLLPPNLLQALPLLEMLNIGHCKAMRRIFGMSIDQGSSSNSANNYDLESRNCALEHLVDLVLDNMPNLVRICDGPFTDRFLKNLKRVKVRNCEKLTQDLYDKDDLQYFNFPSLERLHIGEVEKMETLISLPLGRPRSSHLFLNLTILFIAKCPTLKSICSFDSTSSTGSSTSTVAYSIFPKLENLYLRQLEKLDSIIWTGSNPINIGSSSFQNLRKLEVDRCNSLKYLFSPLLAKQLPRLQSLWVRSCERIEKLILITDGEEESTSTAAGRILTTDIEDVLPQLRSLRLDYLPKLVSVLSVETIFLQFPSLVDIIVLWCSKLKHLSLGPNSSPLLATIWGSQEWLQALEEDMTMETKSRFKPLFRWPDTSDPGESE